MASLNNSEPLYIGKHITWPDRLFVGNMDDILVTKRVLNDAEIQELLADGAFPSIQLETPVLTAGEPLEVFAALKIAGDVQLQPAVPARDFTLSVLQDGQVLSELDLIGGLDETTGEFSHDFTFSDDLEAGAYVLRLAVSDARGRTNQVDIPVRFSRLRTPTLTLVANPKGDESRLGGPYTAGYTVDPRIESMTLTGRINYADGTFAAIPLQLESPLPPSGGVSFDIADAQVKPGRNEIVVTLDDGYNPPVLARTEINFSAPVVTITAPLNNASIPGGTANVQFRVTYTGVNPNPGSLPSAQVSLNNVAQPNKTPAGTPTTGLFQYSFSADELREGGNTVGIQVADFRVPEVRSAPANISFNYFNLPSVQIDSLGNANLPSGADVPITVTTAIAGGGQIARLELSVGNTVVPDLFSQANLLGQLSATIPARYFVPGNNTVRVRVFSANNVEGTPATQTYAYQAAFDFTIISPSAAAPFEISQTSVQVTFDSVNFVNSIDGTISINGVRAVAFTGTGAGPRFSVALPHGSFTANSSNTLQITATSNGQSVTKSVTFNTTGEGGNLPDGSDVVVFNDSNAFLSEHTQNQPFFENLMVFGSSAFQSSRSVVMFDNRLTEECASVGQCNQGRAILQTIARRNGLTFNDITATSDAVYRSIGSNVRIIFLFGMIDGLATAEMDSLRSFVLGGGRVVFIGDHPGATTLANPNTLNTIYSRLGISVRNIVINGATNNETLLPNSLAVHPVLNGIEELFIGGGGATTYGAGALPLFIADRGPVVIVAKIPGAAQ